MVSWPCICNKRRLPSRISAAFSNEALPVVVMFKLKGSLDLAPLFFVSMVGGCEMHDGTRAQNALWYKKTNAIARIKHKNN